MRRGLLIFILVNLLILTLLVRSVSTLLSLLVEDAAADAIHRAELPSPNSSLIETRPQIIPKIIHQTYKNETIPEVWREARQSCIDLHPDYEYIVRGHRPGNELGAVVGSPKIVNSLCSCGLMKSLVNSSPPSTPGFWTPLTATHTPSSAQTRFATLFWRITVVPISTWMMYALSLRWCPN